MKKNIILMIALLSCGINADKSSWRHHRAAQPAWRHNGIYIVNKSDGYLTISWDVGEMKLRPANENETSKLLIPVSAGTEIHVSFSDTISDHAALHSCRGGAHLSFKTTKRMVVYEIMGGYEEGKGPFNRPGTGPHCHIKMHHQSLTRERAIEKYPDLK